MNKREKNLTLYLAAGTVSFSAIAYELVLATYATFLLGSTVFQYTLVFSVMMAAMGVGSYLAVSVEKKAYEIFLLAEMGLALLAILSIPLLYWIFSTGAGTTFVLTLLVSLFGVLIGLEVPLLNAVKTSEGTVSRVLFSDYLGGFAGGLLFPLVLLPALGFFRLSALLAALNIAIALRFLYVFRIHLKQIFVKARVALGALAVIAFLYFIFGEAIRHYLEDRLFGIHS